MGVGVVFSRTAGVDVGVGEDVGVLSFSWAGVGDGDGDDEEVAGFGATFTGTAEGVAEAEVAATAVPLVEGLEEQRLFRERSRLKADTGRAGSGVGFCSPSARC